MKKMFTGKCFEKLVMGLPRVGDEVEVQHVKTIDGVKFYSIKGRKIFDMWCKEQYLSEDCFTELPFRNEWTHALAQARVITDHRLAAAQRCELNPNFNKDADF